MAIDLADHTLKLRIQDTPVELIARRIRQARVEMRLSHDDFGELAGGIGRHHLIKLEQARHRPKVETLRRIASAADRPVEWFLEDERT